MPNAAGLDRGAVGGFQEASQLVFAAVRPTRGHALERALLGRFQEGRPGEDKGALTPVRIGEACVNGPDFAVAIEKYETEWHRRGSTIEHSKRGAQDA